jgi:hypothetical protein
MQFRELESIVANTLSVFEGLGGAKYSDDAVDLLVMIACHESLLGKYTKQVNGPALGIYQMEPFTHADLYKNFISKNQKLDFAVSKFLPSQHSLVDKSTHAELLQTDVRYATIMARVFFMRFKDPIPKDDVGKAEYCKKYWNTELGKATVASYLNDYQRFKRAAYGI